MALIRIHLCPASYARLSECLKQSKALRGRTTARPPLVNGHEFDSQPSCLASGDKHPWRTLEIGKDLALTWQGTRILGQLTSIVDDLGSDTGRLGGVWRPLGEVLAVLE